MLQISFHTFLHERVFECTTTTTSSVLWYFWDCLKNQFLQFLVAFFGFFNYLFRGNGAFRPNIIVGNYRNRNITQFSFPRQDTLGINRPFQQYPRSMSGKVWIRRVWKTVVLLCKRMSLFLWRLFLCFLTRL